MVDFMCIGAAKSGTTWLYNMLSQHPEIYIPSIKEIHYFNPFHPENFNIPNRNYTKGEDWYHSFYANAKPNQLLGDFSTSYLRFKGVPLKLHSYNPNLKLIVILRNPIDRAWSHFNFLKSRGMIRVGSFHKAIEVHPSILKAGLYGEQLEDYLKVFPKEQLKFIKFENLKNPKSVVDEVLTFLGISRYLPKNLFSKINQTSAVRSENLQTLVTRLKHGLVGKALQKVHLSGLFIKFYNWNTTPTINNTSIPEDVKKTLIDYYKDDLFRVKEFHILDIDDW